LLTVKCEKTSEQWIEVKILVQAKNLACYLDSLRVSKGNLEATPELEPSPLKMTSSLYVQDGTVVSA
jgi:hypothetical protein